MSSSCLCSDTITKGCWICKLLFLVRHGLFGQRCSLFNNLNGYSSKLMPNLDHRRSSDRPQMCSTPLQHLFMRNMWELGVNSFPSHIVSISVSISIPLIFSSLKNVLCGTQHRKDSRSLLPVESSSDRITQALHVEPKPTGRGAENINLTCRSLYIPIICNTFSDFL